jgi:hypothetical protein
LSLVYSFIQGQTWPCQKEEEKPKRLKKKCLVMCNVKQWLIEYCHDVLNGDIVACEKHKWACLRFLNDIEKEGTDDFPYVV